MYEYKSLKERMEEVDNDFIDVLFDSPLFNNGHKNDVDIHTSIKDEDILKIDEEDVLPF